MAAPFLVEPAGAVFVPDCEVMVFVLYLLLVPYPLAVPVPVPVPDEATEPLVLKVAGPDVGLMETVLSGREPLVVYMST